MTQVPSEGRRTISTAVLLLLGTIVTTLASFSGSPVVRVISFVYESAEDSLALVLAWSFLRRVKTSSSQVSWH
ncbi:MAG: hypothetical protein F6J96_30260 [Symploca sp. SIO1C2]|nr:hypothetical protein [Symploca sp. SIO1C2]